MRDFDLHLAISSLLLINLIWALVASKRKHSISKPRHVLIFISMTLFPILIVATGFMLRGLPFDPDRSSFTPRAFPVYGFYCGNVLYAMWLVSASKGARWLVSSICLIYLWISLFCMALASLMITNNAAI
jgi:hypothetical protein